MANCTITHIEIPAPSLEKAINFYEKVFNWKIEIVAENVYAFFRIGDLNSGGGFDTTLIPAPEKSGMQIVIDVEDIILALDRITQAGGIVKLGKTEIPGGHGFYAVFQDPNGNYLQIHSNS